MVLKGVLQRQMVKGVMNSVERREFLLIVNTDVLSRCTGTFAPLHSRWIFQQHPGLPVYVSRKNMISGGRGQAGPILFVLTYILR